MPWPDEADGALPRNSAPVGGSCVPLTSRDLPDLKAAGKYLALLGVEGPVDPAGDGL